MSTSRYAATGLLLGIAWGVAARVWMRLISTSPGFTWGGTLSIVGTAAVIGTALGLVAAARHRAASGWWRMLGLLVPVILVSPGMVFLPAVLLGGWGLRRGPLGRLVAAAGLVSAPVILVAVTWDDVTRSLMPYPDTVYRAVLAVGGLALAAGAAWGASVALGPWRSRPARSLRRDGVSVAV